MALSIKPLGSAPNDAPELRQKLRAASVELTTKLKPIEKRKGRIDANLRKSRESAANGSVKVSR
jgi:hypothetical protein